jgi:hypothetical protein
MEKSNKKEVWESFLDILVSVAITWFFALVVFVVIEFIRGNIIWIKC